MNKKNTKFSPSFKNHIKLLEIDKAYAYLFKVKNKSDLKDYATLFGETYLEVLKLVTQENWEEAQIKLNAFEEELDDDNKEIACYFIKAFLAAKKEDKKTAMTSVSKIIDDYDIDDFDYQTEFLFMVREYAYSYLINTRIAEGENETALYLLRVLLGELQMIHSQSFKKRSIVLPYYEKMAHILYELKNEQGFISIADAILTIDPDNDIQIKVQKINKDSLVREKEMIEGIEKLDDVSTLLDQLQKDMEWLTNMGIRNEYQIEYASSFLEKDLIDFEQKTNIKLPPNYKSFVQSKGNFKTKYNINDEKLWILELFPLSEVQSFMEFLAANDLPESLLINDAYFSQEKVDSFKRLLIVGRFFEDDDEFTKVQLLLFDLDSKSDIGDMNTIWYTYHTDFDFDGDFHFDPTTTATTCGFTKMIKDYSVRALQSFFRNSFV